MIKSFADAIIGLVEELDEKEGYIDSICLSELTFKRFLAEKFVNPDLFAKHGPVTEYYYYCTNTGRSVKIYPSPGAKLVSND